MIDWVQRWLISNVGPGLVAWPPNSLTLCRNRGPCRRPSTAATTACVFMLAMCCTHRVTAAEFGSSNGAAIETDGLKARDSIFFADGSDEAWSVERIETGCFLMSPKRSRDIRAAIGVTPNFGLGLILINLPLSVSRLQTTEQITMTVGDQPLTRNGRLVASEEIFVPLSLSDANVLLQSVEETDTLWVTLRRTAVVLGGRHAGTAIAAYRATCGTSIGSKR